MGLHGIAIVPYETIVGVIWDLVNKVEQSRTKLVLRVN